MTAFNINIRNLALTLVVELRKGGGGRRGEGIYMTPCHFSLLKYMHTKPKYQQNGI